MESGIAVLLGILIQWLFKRFKDWPVKPVIKVAIILGVSLVAGTGLGLVTGAITFADFSVETVSALGSQIFASATLVYRWLRDRGLYVPDVNDN